MTLLVVVLVLSTASLYISSLASSGIRALILCVPVVAGGIPLVSWITVLAERTVRAFVRNAGWHVGSAPTDAQVLTSALLFAAGFAALAIRFGASNYRRGDRSLTRIVGQVTCIFAYALVAVTFGTFLGTSAISRFYLNGVTDPLVSGLIRICFPTLGTPLVLTTCRV